jgi:hypothetical protein
MWNTFIDRHWFAVATAQQAAIALTAVACVACTATGQGSTQFSKSVPDTSIASQDGTGGMPADSSGKTDSASSSKFPSCTASCKTECASIAKACKQSYCGPSFGTPACYECESHQWLCNSNCVCSCYTFWPTGQTSDQASCQSACRSVCDDEGLTCQQTCGAECHAKGAGSMCYAACTNSCANAKLKCVWSKTAPCAY